ncbi:MAG: DNA topoisomerase III [Clostridia bacterium]|nr:DNA topoisomerase III [Clostridia bacterium]
MGKIVVLAEKPSVARELARVLGSTKRADGYIDGSTYTVTWALGHLVTLATPDKYNKDYEKWRMEHLPILPEKIKLEVIKETSKQFKIVKELLKKETTDSLIIATDAGREGELVARWIVEKAAFKKPIKRLWISSQTDKAIKDGFKNLKDGKEYESLYKSGVCRAHADWIVGLNVTRALTCKFGAKLSAGRVQTPTLYMIVNREKEIEQFSSKPFYTVEAITRNLKFKYRDKSGQVRIYDKDKATSIIESIKGKALTAKEVKKEKKRDLAPQLYDLTELQRDANKIYKYSAKQTLSIMQSLYERHKIVSYPRTDSKYLSEDIVDSFKERLDAISINEYAKIVKSIDLSNFKADKRFVDNLKVSDHHAIIPTEQSVNKFALSEEERNIFDLVAKRFLGMFVGPCEYQSTTVVCECGESEFYAKGKIVTNAGWRNVFNTVDDQEQEDEDQTMPEINEGDTFKISDTKLTEGHTQPPSRYTEASILYAMENAGKFVEGKEFKEVLKEVSGIGTPATRADIIEKLVDSGSVERVNNTLVPTKKGIQLIDIVPSDLKSPELTAKWEDKLIKISKGSENPKEFIKQMESYSLSLVEAVKGSAKTYKHENITKEICPECGAFLLDVNGKKGKMLVCSNTECKYRKNVSFNTNNRCPTCHKKMILTESKNGKVFRCTCGYSAKADEKKESKKNSSYSDVKSYMNKSKKEEQEFKNNALFEALNAALGKK